MKPLRKIDLGSIHIHRKVIAEIITAALDDIKGVSLYDGGWIKKSAASLSKNQTPGITIQVDDQHDVTLGVDVRIHYGLNIQDAATLIQDTVKTAINKTVDMNIKDINVNIVGIFKGVL